MQYKWIFIRNENGEHVKVKCYIVPDKCRCKNFKKATL